MAPPSAVRFRSAALEHAKSELLSLGMVVPARNLRRLPGRFAAEFEARGLAPLRSASAVTTLQINMGKLCNQACRHCHVDAGPKRTELMDRRTAERCMALVEATSTVDTVDITGGAPELNPHFRYLVQRSRELGRTVMDRCNLTILLEPGHEDLAEFLAAHQVHVVASLPCYSLANVDGQRGKGVFDGSIEGLRRLNALGYGRGLPLDLVYNPGGPFLPPSQAELELAYKRELFDQFGIVFDNLLTMANLPIARFAHDLERDGKLEDYLALLRDNFNPATVPAVMCRSLVSVSYTGQLHDCDFNQMLDMPLRASTTTVWDIGSLSELAERTIAVADHCFGCTAGAGSSCGGALA